jgi:hypothetical protein
VSKLLRLLRAKYASPLGLRYPIYLATVIVVWGVLSVAGVGLAVALASGAAAGFAAEIAVDAWWRRRERQRDLRNGYTPSPAGPSVERPADDGAP